MTGRQGLPVMLRHSHKTQTKIRKEGVHMSNDSRTELLQLRNHLNNLIMVSGVTEERLSQLHLIERLLKEDETDEAEKSA